jgi:hypothetical protein
MGAPIAYINSGFTTTAHVTGSLFTPNGYVNTGIITNINGAAGGANGGTLKYLNGQFGGSLWLSGSSASQGLRANVGVITNFGKANELTLINCGNGASGNPVGVVTAALFRSQIPTGTAPITVTSTTKCTNLNADLLDGRNSTGYLRGINGVWNASDDGANRLYFVNNGKTIYGNSADGVHEWRGTANSERMTLDNSGNLSADGEICASSDARLKTNVKTIENGLDKVLQLRGVEFDRIDKDAHQIGVIAQEVEEIVPDVVHTNEKGMKSVAYGNLVAVLIEAVKDLKGEITELRAELDELKGNK